MARLHVERMDRRATVGTLTWVKTQWPIQEEDDRPKTEATERMYWRSDGRLAFKAGDMVPDDERPLLIGEKKYMKALRGES